MKHGQTHAHTLTRADTWGCGSARATPQHQQPKDTPVTCSARPAARARRGLPPIPRETRATLGHRGGPAGSQRGLLPTPRLQTATAGKGDDLHPQTPQNPLGPSPRLLAGRSSIRRAPPTHPGPRGARGPPPPLPGHPPPPGLSPATTRMDLPLPLHTDSRGPGPAEAPHPHRPGTWGGGLPLRLAAGGRRRRREEEGEEGAGARRGLASPRRPDET